MKENSYKYIINNLLIENTEKSLFKLVEIYKDINFEKSICYMIRNYSIVILHFVYIE